MHYLRALYITFYLASNSFASLTLNAPQDPSKTQSSISSEILVLDTVLKSLKTFTKFKDGTDEFEFADDSQNEINNIIPETIFDFDDDKLASGNSTLPRKLVKRQVQSDCGYYPCPQQPPCYGGQCPFAPHGPPLHPFPVIPPIPPVIPGTYVLPPYERPPPPPPPPTYIPTPLLPVIFPPQPTYLPRPPYRPPITRPTYPPRPRPTVQPRPTYPPRPRPTVQPRRTYPPRPRPTVQPRSTYPPRLRPVTLPAPVCPPVFPNTSNQWDNLRIFVSQAENCKPQGCNNRCTRPRKEHCTIDYDTLLMRLSFIEEKLRGLRTIESRLKVHIALLLGIKRNPRYPGKVGPKGSLGPKGSQGLKGPIGHTGGNGVCITNTVASPPSGPPGPPGNKGDPGHPGEKICNCNGIKGDEGPPGDDVNGSPGPRGFKGAKGQRGLQRSHRN